MCAICVFQCLRMFGLLGMKVQHCRESITRESWSMVVQMPWEVGYKVMEIYIVKTTKFCHCDRGQ